MQTLRPVRHSRASLRTKTGCLQCRQRRKKCDEVWPRCTLCVTSERTCVWPSATLLFDRRNLPRTAAKHGRAQDRNTAIDPIVPSCLTAEAAVASIALSGGLEVVIARHFSERYYTLLINPDSHQDFHDEWLQDIQSSMSCCSGLRYSVLANAASHLFLAGHAAQMQHLALSYYSRSLRGLSGAIAKPDFKSHHRKNDVLMSIMLLYLHGCMGHGTFKDIPLHVNAAIRIVEHQYMHSNPPTALHRPFDRLAVESVIYQIFLVQMGLWSDTPSDPSERDFDPHFWLKCGSLLARSTLYPDLSETCNSPVLGMPFALFKVMLMIKKLWISDRDIPSFWRSLDRLEAEIRPRETAVMLALQSKMSPINAPQPQMQVSPTITEDATSILTLCASLLISQLRETDYMLKCASLDKLDRRQQCIVSILRRRAEDRQWTQSCTSNYPVYVAGYFVNSKEQVELVRTEMRRRFEQMSWSQVKRFWQDLEQVWHHRSSSS